MPDINLGQVGGLFQNLARRVSVGVDRNLGPAARKALGATQYSNFNNITSAAKPMSALGANAKLAGVIAKPVAGYGLPVMDFGWRVAGGENPVNAGITVAGGELGALGAGAAASRFGAGPMGQAIAGMVGYATASPAFNAGLDWLGKNAVLSDRGAINSGQPQKPRIGGIPAKDRTGESYRDQELRLSAAARAAGGPSAGGGIGGGNMASYVPNPQSSPAAERAYQGEVFRTAQLAAQSPEMLAYAAQREKDLKSKDYSKSEDMGMRIWAQKYGPGSKNDLASKVKPGQAGYDVIQEVIKGKATPSAAAAPAATAYNPFAINAYSSNFKLPGMEEYANSMQGAIVRAPGIMPSYAQDNPMLGDYNSTINQGYNLSFPIVPTTTVNTNSAAMGAALYTPNSSVQAMGNFAGPPIKIPIGNTPFGTMGYPAFTAGALLPNITKEQIFGPKAEGKFNAMFSANR
jgi:hypothetical protein